MATQNLDLSVRLLVFVGWRGLGLAVLPFIEANKSGKILDTDRTSSPQVAQRKELILYFIPWVTFSLINGIDTHVYGKFHTQEVIEAGLTLIHLSGSFSSLLAGIAIDFIGRRTSITFAMVILGLGFVALSFAQTSLASWLFFSFTTGIAWGILSIVYVLVLWGELATREKREKYYAIGMIPFFLSQAVGYILNPMLSGLSSTQLFSTATLLNFLAVIPLLFAQEVLPSRTMEQRRIRDYIRKAKQLADEGKSR
jgi:MFS family permease